MDRKVFAFQVALVLVLGLISIPPASAEAAEKARNVIVLIADGCSAEQYTFGRWFKGAALSFDAFRVGAVKTHIADSIVADSAPAASAYATGVRTSSRFISVGPRPETIPAVPVPEPPVQYRPMATILEGARLMGKATGIVSTARVSHATPGAFVAHTQRRGLEDDIMEQAVYQRVEVVFGGGKALLRPRESGGARADGEDLTAELKGRGYRLVEDRHELMKVKQGPVFGMFAAGHMDPEIDRTRLHPDQPTLEEMTRKAIELLSSDPDGFFLMVEGSQIDWACHANDPGHLLSDLLAFDKAAEAALDFARKDGRTLVLVLSDHNTGGFSIGNYEKGGIYSRMKDDAFLAPFKKMKSSAHAIWRTLGNERDLPGLKDAVRRGWGMEITEADAEQILLLSDEYKKRGLAEHFALGRILCPRYTFVGWTTHGHTGGDVPLHAYGPARPAGLLDAPDIGRVCAAAMGLNLGTLNQRLFVDAGKVFGEDHVGLNKSDPSNPALLIRHDGKNAELPINKHWLILDGKARRTEGVVVYAEATGKAYIPMQAVNIIRGSTAALPPVQDP